jgi:hypothetical protein
MRQVHANRGGDRHILRPLEIWQGNIVQNEHRPNELTIPMKEQVTCNLSIPPLLY